MVRLVVLVFFTMALPCKSLTADAACQTAYDALQNMTQGNLCKGDDTTCPDTCKAKLDETDESCAGKNVEVTDSAGVSTVVTYASQWITTAGTLAHLESGKACSSILFVYKIALVTNCRESWDFTATQLDNDFGSDFCKDSAGGLSETSCHENCQALVDGILEKCKTGDVYVTIDDEDFMWSPESAYVTSDQGPDTCSWGSALISGVRTLPAGFLIAIVAAFLLG